MMDAARRCATAKNTLTPRSIGVHLGPQAKPTKNTDGSQNILQWDCKIPGKTGTDWDGGVFSLRVAFPEDYPTGPPVVTFVPPIFHPNVYANGNVCLSILSSGWKASLTIKHVLTGVQTLLNEPNPRSPANMTASNMWSKERAKYRRRVKEQAKKFTPVDAILTSSSSNPDVIVL